MGHIIQRTLFSEKDAFNQNDFESKCMNNIFITCVSSGISRAVEKVAYANLQTRLRVKSDSIHDVAFAEIQNAISRSELYNKVEFHSDISGNKRLWFSYNNYMFILCKSESEGNKSSISDIIDSQNASCHVITIKYTINSTWDGIVSASFQYIRNKVVEMVHYIPIMNDTKMYLDLDIDTDNSNEIPAAKATLKISSKKAK